MAAFRAHQLRDPADFIYAQGLTGLAFVRARRRGEALPPVGVNAHGYEMFQSCFGLKELAAQLLLRPQTRMVTREADVLFSFSGRIRDIVVNRLGADPSRVVVIPNGVDDSWLTTVSRPPSRPRRFLFVGRYERRKGIPELTAALRSLGPEGWEMDFVGPIPAHERMDDPRVRYHGSIRDASRLLQLYDASDCMVCPSHSEGMPTVLIEAMARGVMLIATDVGAVEELVTPETGILLPGPIPSLIAQAMTHVIDMPDERLSAIRGACRARAFSYRWENVAGRVIAAASDRC
jgi:glycosyltransferase involved in cell wall biosynthesis